MEEKRLKKITIEEMITVPEELNEELKQLSVESLELMIGASEEQIKEWEEALRCNVKWPSNKQILEIKLDSIKKKKGWFFNLLRKYTEHQLRRNIDKAHKKLDRNSREFLEGIVWRRKRTVALLKEYKKEKN